VFCFSIQNLIITERKADRFENREEKKEKKSKWFCDARREQQRKKKRQKRDYREKENSIRRHI